MFSHFGCPAEEAACPSSAGSEIVAGFSWRPDAAASGKKQKDKLGKKKNKRHYPTMFLHECTLTIPSYTALIFFFFLHTLLGLSLHRDVKDKKEKEFSPDNSIYLVNWHMRHKLLTRQRPRAQTFLVKYYFLKLQSLTCIGDFTAPKMTKEHIQNISVGEVRVWECVCVRARVYVQYIYIYIYILYV